MSTIRQVGKLTILFIAIGAVTACASTTDTMHNHVVPGCNPGTEVIQIKLDTATNTPALVQRGQSTVCVVAGGKVKWTLVQTPGSNREFTIYFKDGSYTETTTNGNLVFDKTRVKSVEAYSYGISMPGANDLDPIIVIMPEFSR